MTNCVTHRPYPSMGYIMFCGYCVLVFLLLNVLSSVVTVMNTFESYLSVDLEMCLCALACVLFSTEVIITNDIFTRALCPHTGNGTIDCLSCIFLFCSFALRTVIPPFSFILVFLTRNLKCYVSLTCTCLLCRHLGIEMYNCVCMFLPFLLNINFISIIVTRKLQRRMGIEKCYVRYASVSFSVNLQVPRLHLYLRIAPSNGWSDSLFLLHFQAICSTF